MTNIPSEITSGNIIDLVNDRIEDINSWTGLAISGNNIPNNTVSTLKDFATADVLARTLGVDIDTEISVGNIKLAYRDQFQAENRQIEYFLEKAEKSLSMLGKRITHTSTIKVA
jgi:hypothetical protein